MMTDLFHLRQGLRDPLKHALQDRAQGEDRAGPALQRRPDDVDAGMDASQFALSLRRTDICHQEIAWLFS